MLAHRHVGGSGTLGFLPAHAHSGRGTGTQTRQGMAGGQARPGKAGKAGRPGRQAGMENKEASNQKAAGLMATGVGFWDSRPDPGHENCARLPGARFFWLLLW